MNPDSFPTKGNLMSAKNSLALARQGCVLMGKKQNILIRELIELIDQVRDIQFGINVTFQEAYLALQMANIELGINYIQEINISVPIKTGIRIRTRNIMGTGTLLVQYEETPMGLTYAYYSAKESLDEARAGFEKVKKLTIRLSMIENSTYHLANNVKKTQRRASALKNITILIYDTLTENVSNALEEKEYKEFTRLRIIKRNRMKVEQLK